MKRIANRLGIFTRLVVVPLVGLLLGALVFSGPAYAGAGDDATTNEVGTWAIGYYVPPMTVPYPGWTLGNIASSTMLSNYDQWPYTGLAGLPHVH